MDPAAIHPRSDARADAREALLADLVASPRRFLRTKDVAVLFQVSERSVAEWARRGKLPCVRTPGGHRRYPTERIVEIVHGVEHDGEGRQ